MSVAWLAAGIPDDVGHMCGFLPQGEFSEAPLFTLMVSMIRPENHDGVVRVRAGLQGIEHASDIGIGPRDTREIGPVHFLPCLIRSVP